MSKRGTDARVHWVASPLRRVMMALSGVLLASVGLLLVGKKKKGAAAAPQTSQG